jgi:hypothetical protein
LTKLVLVLAGAAAVAALTPTAASAGWQCSLQYRDREVAGHTVQQPYCVW